MFEGENFLMALLKNITESAEEVEREQSKQRWPWQPFHKEEKIKLKTSYLKQITALIFGNG